MRRKVLVFFLVIILFPVLCSGQESVPKQLPLAQVIHNLSRSLSHGSWFRDRCHYFEEIYVERYKKMDSNGGFDDLFYRRRSVAEVSANAKGVVIARLISDTDGNLRPKKVKSSSRTAFGAPAFLELIFFPLYPEKVDMYDITDLGVAKIDGISQKMLRIFPRPEYRNTPLVEGVYYVDPSTGKPIHLTINRLHHFKKLDKHLKKLLEFHCDVYYRILPNGVTVPHTAKGWGYSKITRYKGYFKFTFEEWGYSPNPLYPEVNASFAKMKNYNEDLNNRQSTPKSR